MGYENYKTAEVKLLLDSFFPDYCFSVSVGDVIVDKCEGEDVGVFCLFVEGFYKVTDCRAICFSLPYIYIDRVVDAVGSQIACLKD